MHEGIVVIKENSDDKSGISNIKNKFKSKSKDNRLQIYLFNDVLIHVKSSKKKAGPVPTTSGELTWPLQLVWLLDVKELDNSGLFLLLLSFSFPSFSFPPTYLSAFPHSLPFLPPSFPFPFSLPLLPFLPPLSLPLLPCLSYPLFLFYVITLVPPLLPPPLCWIPPIPSFLLLPLPLFPLLPSFLPSCPSLSPYSPFSSTILLPPSLPPSFYPPAVSS